MSTGFVPFPIRSVKPFVVVVQEGDSVSKIAHGMTGDASRWTELVGANPQKQLSSGNVAGSPYRVFASLDVDEKLMVPASWPDPGHLGDSVFGQIQNKGASNILQSGKKSDDSLQSGTYLDPLGTLIQSILTTTNTPAPPLPYTVPDLSQVIASWWPLITQINPQAFPYTTPAIPTPQTLPAWQGLLQSAIAFLTTGKLPTGTELAEMLKAIPWQAIPWDKIPWKEIGTQVANGMMSSEFWKILINSAKMAPSAQSYSGSLEPSNIDFLNPATWTNPPFSYVNDYGWKNVPWSEAGGTNAVTVWGNIADADILACIQANPARAAELVKLNAQCGFDKDLAKLKLYMCDPKLDATKCTTAPGPIPVLPTGVDWACAPAPKCIADQFKALSIQAPCPPPGTAFPACIPDWYKTITGQNLPKESEKESNLPLYLGLSAAGIALVAGVLVIAASD